MLSPAIYLWLIPSWLVRPRLGTFSLSLVITIPFHIPILIKSQVSLTIKQTCQCLCMSNRFVCHLPLICNTHTYTEVHSQGFVSVSEIIFCYFCLDVINLFVYFHIFLCVIMMIGCHNNNISCVEMWKNVNNGDWKCATNGLTTELVLADMDLSDNAYILMVVIKWHAFGNQRCFEIATCVSWGIKVCLFVLELI